MLESKTKWNIHDQIDDLFVKQMIDEMKIDPLVARLLAVRGIDNIYAAQRFLHPEESGFSDPFLLQGMREAVDRIHIALKQGEKIRIYGDYDADGVSSTSLMIYLLRQLGADYDYYIPHRANEGYGLNMQAIDHAKKSGISLIITVDTGISAFHEAAYVKQMNMDLIITDHHEPPKLLPHAIAIINPKQSTCLYPFKQLAGVGVAFKLAHALLGRVPEELLQLAAIGTVADIMPLIDENRLIVKLGLEQMRKNTLIGIKALAGIADIDRRKINAMNIGYGLAPRINACGRLESAKDAVQLLTATNEQEAEHLAYRLDQINKERQIVVESIITEALQMMDERSNEPIDAVIILEQEDWNVGVIGIAASKILEKYYRPVVILSIDSETGLAKGSARSIAGFDMHKALTSCSELLEHYGGHQAAAGMTLHKDHIPQFKKKLIQLAHECLTDGDLIPVTHVDLDCTFNELSLECIEKLESMAPFGKGNPSPRFIFKQLRIHDMKTIGKEQQHLKLMCSQDMDGVKYTMEAVGFHQGYLTHLISPISKVDMIGEVSINEWNGLRKAQLLIKDIRVQNRQIFDWRGKKKSDWIRAQWEPAILVSSADEAHAIAAKLPGLCCSLWSLHPDDRIQPMNDLAQSIDFSEVKDLVLYSLPAQLDRVRTALQHCRSVQRIYALYDSSDRVTGSLPSREAFKKIYSTLLQQKQWSVHDKRIVQALSKRSGMSQAMIEFIFEVFEELSFIEKSGNSYVCVTTPQKKDLITSERYQERMHRMEVEQMLIYTTTAELSQWILQQSST